MNKLLSVIVISLGITFPGFIYAKAQLLIDRLSTEGMLLPEAGSVFNQADEQQPPLAPFKTVETDAVPAPLARKNQTEHKNRTEQVPVQELNRLKRKLSQTQSELQVLNKKYQAQTMPPPPPLTEQTESLKAENKQLQQQLRAAEKQMVENTRRHEKALADQQAGSEKMQHDRTVGLTVADEKIAALTQQIIGLEAQASETAKQSAVMAQQLKEAASEKAALGQLKEQLLVSDKARKQLESELADAGKRQMAVVNERDEASLKLAELKKNLAKISQEQTQLLEQHSAVKSQYTTAKAQLEKATPTVFTLQKNASDEMQISYAFGVYFASHIDREMKILKGAGQLFSQQALLQGVHDKLNKKQQMSEAEVGKALARLDRKAADVNHGEGARNKIKSEQFVAQAAKEPGAVKEANGVVYRVLKQGHTPLLRDQDIIRFKLAEKISTGKVISTEEIRRGLVERLPKFMQQGVKRLGVGGKVKMTVPWSQAYGDAGIPGSIPPAVASELTLEILGVDK